VQHPARAAPPIVERHSPTVGDQILDPPDREPVGINQDIAHQVRVAAYHRPRELQRVPSDSPLPVPPRLRRPQVDRYWTTAHAYKTRGRTLMP